MLNPKCTLLLLSLVLWNVGHVSTHANDIRVQLKPSSSVAGSIVRLHDVAVVDGVNATHASGIAQLELMPAPAVGKSIYLTINDIRHRIVAHGYQPSEVNVVGASRVRIDGVATTTAKFATQFANSNHRSIASTDSDHAVQQAVHVVRNMRRGEVVQVSDVEIRPLTAVRTLGEYPTTLHDVLGKELTRGLAADRPVSDNDLRMPILVHRNQIVTILARSGNVVVRREMMALSDAGLRELVLVQPIEPTLHGRARTAERFQAQVTGPSEAVVVTGHVKVANSTAAWNGNKEAQR